MLNFFSRLFSWEGLSSRKEFFGWLSFLWAILLWGIVWGIIVHFNPILGFSSDTWDIISICALFGYLLIAWVICLFASVRRLRHIGWPSWLVLIPLLVPPIQIIWLILLLIIPGNKRADSPTYFFPNLFLLLTAIAAGVILYLSLGDIPIE